MIGMVLVRVTSRCNAQTRSPGEEGKELKKTNLILILDILLISEEIKRIP